MYTIGLDLSRNQMNKLKKGAKARVKKGMGCNLIVRPETYNILSRAFRRNKGVDISLSPEEIELNMVPSPEEHQALMEQTNMDMASPEAVGAGLNWKKIGRTLKREGIKLAKKEGPKLAKRLAKEAYKSYMEQGAEPDVYGEGLGAGLGAGFGGLYKAHKADLNHALKQANDIKKRVDKRRVVNTDPYLSTGLTGGSMRPSVMPPGLRKRNCLFSKGVAGMRGNGLNLVEGKGVNMSGVHQALQPQPYSANYHFKFMLPPQYQEIQDMTGNGLYL